jgi:cytochrome c peroxidase
MLNSANVPFDAFTTGADAALTEQEKVGFALFDGKAGCSSCHNGALLSDNGYHVTGVPQNEEFFNSPLKQITFRYEQWAKGTPEDIYRTTTEDLGRFYVTKEESDKGAFRTPGLRDVCFTGPYMHNGVFSTLEEVVAFYNAGGGISDNLDPLLVPLDLTENEQADLVAFLSTGLCGDEITDTAPELPPYGVIKP